ncbi:MAG: DUF6491 family protein [Sphingomicrobium sp.]
MRRIFILPVILAATACAARPASDVSIAEPVQECFYASSVTGFSEAGHDKTIVNIGSKESWELSLSGGCPDVDYAMNIGIVSRGSQRICTGRPAELVVPSASGSSSQRCLVRNIRKLSPEEAAAVRGRRTSN